MVKIGINKDIKKLLIGCDNLPAWEKRYSWYATWYTNSQCTINDEIPYFNNTNYESNEEWEINLKMKLGMVWIFTK